VEHQVALTLRLIAGMTPAELARSFLVSEDTIGKRLVRAKYKIKATCIPYRVPVDAELPDRLQAVLSVLYLIYNPGADDAAARGALRREAIRLAREVATLLPGEPEVTGLLALLLLSESRAAAPWVDDSTVLLPGQDRSRWNRELIREGQRLVLTTLRRPDPEAFTLQAAIQGIHCDAARYTDTDWTTILRFYDRLVLRAPTPVVMLNRGIAVGEALGHMLDCERRESRRTARRVPPALCHPSVPPAATGKAQRGGPGLWSRDRPRADRRRQGAASGASSQRSQSRSRGCALNAVGGLRAVAVRR
jgi:RNA polymerase sigma-70 factor (ECF subfamily)